MGMYINSNIIMYIPVRLNSTTYNIYLSIIKYTVFICDDFQITRTH